MFIDPEEEGKRVERLLVLRVLQDDVMAPTPEQRQHQDRDSDRKGDEHRGREKHNILVLRAVATDVHVHAHEAVESLAVVKLGAGVRVADYGRDSSQSKVQQDEYPARVCVAGGLKMVGRVVDARATWATRATRATHLPFQARTLEHVATPD